MTFFEWGYHKTKSDCARIKSRRSLKIEWRTQVSNHGLNGVSLHYVDFELCNKLLLVALGIWLSLVESVNNPL